MLPTGLGGFEPGGVEAARWKIAVIASAAGCATVRGISVADAWSPYKSTVLAQSASNSVLYCAVEHLAGAGRVVAVPTGVEGTGVAADPEPGPAVGVGVAVLALGDRIVIEPPTVRSRLKLSCSMRSASRNNEPIVRSSGSRH